MVQIPVFFALYKVLYTTIEMRHQPFFGWIKDLSAPDPLTILTGFGLFHWQIPPLLHFFNIGIWPLIMGVTMFLQQKLNPAPADPVQARVFQFLPIMFTFMLAPFSAGLVIYWAWSNTLSIAQQYTIMRRHGAPIGGKAQAKAAAANAAATAGATPVPAKAAAARRAARRRADGPQAVQRQRAAPETIEAARKLFAGPCEFIAGAASFESLIPSSPARGGLRRPLQCRQVEPGERADRPAHAGAHLVEPGPHAADQFLRSRPDACSWSTCRATASPRSRSR